MHDGFTGARRALLQSKALDGAAGGDYGIILVPF
jgi:hypothetical protein